MSFEILLLLGIIFNAVVALFSRGFKSYTTGIDSLPAISIIAGFFYGSYAGLLAGLIVSIIYYVLRLSNVHYAPLTITLNVLVGFLAHYLNFSGIFAAGMILLVIYHVVSGVILGMLGGLKPGYFTFVILNFFTTLVLLLVAALFG